MTPGVDGGGAATLPVKTVVSAVQHPQTGEWVPPGIQVRSDYDANTGKYKWQTDATQTQVKFQLDTPDGFTAGKWGVNVRTGAPVAWDNRGTVDVNGKQMPAQWNEDMTIMSPEQAVRYFAYERQQPGAKNYQDWYPAQFVHHDNPHIRDRARHFARTGEFLDIDNNLLYDRDAYYRGDATAAQHFRAAADEFHFGNFTDHPFRSADRKDDLLYRQMFFDNNKRQLYALAQQRAPRWLAMNGLSHGHDGPNARPNFYSYGGLSWKNQVNQVLHYIPNFHDLSKEQKLTQLYNLYRRVATEDSLSPSLGPTISMLYLMNSAETKSSGGFVPKTTVLSSFNLMGDYLNPDTKTPYTNYTPSYGLFLRRPTDPLQISTARHFGLLDANGNTLQPDAVAENFVQSNKWLWDPEAYHAYIDSAVKRGQVDAQRNLVPELFFTARPGAHTMAQHNRPGSAITPMWMGSNPLFNDLDTAYVHGVGDTIRNNHRNTEKNLGIAAHISGSVMRGGINFFTLGFGNTASDRLFKYLNGTTVEQNFANAVLNGANPYALATAGVVAENYPMILSLGVRGPAPAAGTASRFQDVFTTAQALRKGNVYGGIYGIGTGASKVRGTQALVNFMASTKRNFGGYTQPVGSPEQQAALIEAAGQNHSTILMPWTTFNPIAQGLGFNAGEYEARSRAIMQSDDPKLIEELDARNKADIANTAVDMAAFGMGGLSKWLKPVGFTLQTGTPVLSYAVFDQARKPVVNPNAGFWERYTPALIQQTIAAKTGNTQWLDRLGYTNLFREEQVLSNQPGYNIPMHKNYWGRRYFGANQEERAAIMLNKHNPIRKDDGSPYDPNNPVDNEEYTTRALRMQVSRGEPPPSLYSSPEFKNLPIKRKQEIFASLIQSQMTLKADPKKHAAVIDMFTKAAKDGSIPDLDVLFTGDFKDDHTFDPIRQYAKSMMQSASLPELLTMAAEPGTGSGNTYMRSIAENAPAWNQLTVDSIAGSPELQTQIITVAEKNPEAFNKVLQSERFQQIDLSALLKPSQGAPNGNTQSLMNFFGQLVTKNTDVRDFVTRKVEAIPTRDFLGLIQSNVQGQSSTEGEDSNGAAGNTPQIPTALRSIVETDLQRRLKAGTPESVEIAYALTPHMRDMMLKKSNGPHVNKETATAFLHVMTQPEYWNKFDSTSMLQMCEFFNSKNGAAAFAGMSPEEQGEWKNRITTTVEPIVRQHAMDALKRGEVETFRRFMALKYKFAGDPIAFYGSAAALILGGITVLGSLFSSDDDDDEEDEEEDADDDAAYRKRIRKQLRQKDTLLPDLDDDEED
jgi:hypothetical protein